MTSSSPARSERLSWGSTSQRIPRVASPSASPGSWLARSGRARSGWESSWTKPTTRSRRRSRRPGSISPRFTARCGRRISSGSRFPSSLWPGSAEPRRRSRGRPFSPAVARFCSTPPPGETAAPGSVSTGGFSTERPFPSRSFSPGASTRATSRRPSAACGRRPSTSRRASSRRPGSKTDGRWSFSSRRSRGPMSVRARPASPRGYFGAYGGRFAPETLMAPLEQLERAFERFRRDRRFRAELTDLLKNYAGRPTPVTFAARLSEIAGGARIALKREDLLHTGAHKLNNSLGQVLLARRMGKTRVIAETGAGQHGVATAAAAARMGLPCRVYMGVVDMERQAPNVARMRLMGAEVVSVDSGSRTLKDAINEAMRDWSENVATTHYVLGSALGPHPYPSMVREFHAVIGREARGQMRRLAGRDPDAAVACVGGGSNAIGLFSAFLAGRTRLYGVEAGGRSLAPGEHAARFSGGSVGVLHGTRTMLLQDEAGQVLPTHSVSAGLDYPAVGPEHADLFERGRVTYTAVSDAQALEAFETLTRAEGILPALESAHAVAYAVGLAREMPKSRWILVNLSGRGDKDLDEFLRLRSNL